VNDALETAVRSIVGLLVNGERPTFHVGASLWTKEEGRSDLTLSLHLTETPQHIYEIEVLDLHVL